jgi:transposase, IS30 family
MKAYTQLTQDQRYQISAFLKAGFSQSQIARELAVDKSTISRELRRNRGARGYRPKQAHHKAQDRCQAKHNATRIKAETWQQIELLLRQQWSPEQISGYHKKQNLASVSPERIYQYIYADKAKGGDLHTHLRCRKKRRKRYGSHDRRGQILNRKSIAQRPAIVAEKSRLGDWEADTIIGKGHQQALVSLTERQSKCLLLAKVERKTEDLVQAAMVRLLTPYREQVKTITSDNGKEFAAHEAIARALGADFYFAHPYASWERGLNENSNGLVRQYFPKGSDFTLITQADLDQVLERLNHRPRKTLGYQTPFEVFFNLSKVALRC